MAIESISRWLLSEKDYELGVKLYNQYGSNFLLKKEFASGADKYNVKKLLNELQKINNADNTSQVKVNEEKSTLPVIAPPIPYHDQLLEVRSGRKNKYKQVNHLHSTLSLIQDQEKRKLVAFEILDLWDDINSSWEVEDNFLTTGKFEPVKPSDNSLPDNPVQLSRMLNNVRSNITKATKKLKAAQSKANNESEILEKKIHLQNHINTKELIEAKLVTYERS